MTRKNQRATILQKQETLQCSEQKFCQKNTNDKQTQCSAYCFVKGTQCCNRAFFHMNVSKFQIIRKLIGIAQSVISNVNTLGSHVLGSEIAYELPSLDVMDELSNFFTHGQCCSLCSIHFEQIKQKITSILLHSYSEKMVDTIMHNLFCEEVLEDYQNLQEMLHRYN